jgi:uncharacterized protein (DUF433 family)
MDFQSVVLTDWMNPMSSIAIDHIELRSNRAGDPRAYIVGTRIRVQDVSVMAEIQGKTPEEIVNAFPHLTLGQVHAALSYYFDHRAEIVQQMRDDEVFVAEMRKATGPGPLETYLAAQKTTPTN